MREDEVKLQVEDDFEVPDLAGVVQGAETSPASERRVEDTYYDTDDRSLLRWGCTLRHRKRQGWTVKLPLSHRGRLLSREEITVRGRAGKPPPAALDLVTSYTRGRPLEVIARLDTTRATHDLVSSDGQLLVEVADDRTAATTPDGTTTTFRQIEAELGPGVDPAVLDQVVDHLMAAGARPDPEAVKVLRAMGRPSLDPPDVVAAPLGKRPSAGVVLQRALARSAVQLTTELPFALAGQPRGVHQARVATRRLRSDLRTFEALLDPAVAARLRDDLRPLADRLGAIRDADVLLDRLQQTLDRHPEIDPDGGAAVLALLAAQREVARDALAEYVAGEECHGVLDSVVAVTTGPPTTSAADAPAADLLPPLVRKRWRKLHRTRSRLGPDPDPASLHRVRLLTKRTRYAAEAVAGAFGKPARRFATSLAEVQDRLGERNDADVAERWLIANCDELDPAAAFAAGRLAQLLHLAARADQAWTEPYRQAARKRNTTWFA